MKRSVSNELWEPVELPLPTQPPKPKGIHDQDPEQENSRVSVNLL